LDIFGKKYIYEALDDARGTGLRYEGSREEIVLSLRDDAARIRPQPPPRADGSKGN